MFSGEFPEGLASWAGHRAGGVRRLFHAQSGRPSGTLIKTSLLNRLERWVTDFLGEQASKPRIIILVGGPGNGKTEAIEACIRQIDSSASLDGKLIDTVAEDFRIGTGRPVPRLAQVDVGRLSEGRYDFSVAIVQDASVTDPAYPGQSAAELFLGDLEKFAFVKSGPVYLACVNRGVLDDALTCAIDMNRVEARNLLEHIVRAVSMTSDAPSAWPLQDFPAVAVWPMDIESLLVAGAVQEKSSAAELLSIATRAEAWPSFSTCAAGRLCPFCNSRRFLDEDAKSKSLLQLLRWYELASGKRWNFRDLGSLISFLLAGVTSQRDGKTVGPCARSAKLLELNAAQTPSAKSSLALFQLVDSLYYHALFGRWPRSAARSLRRDLRDLGLDTDATLMGFTTFLAGQRDRALPSTLEPQLANLSDLMDPALADPDQDIVLATNRAIKFRDIDARFSQSVFEGLKFVQPLNVLTELEVKLLVKLGFADQSLSSPNVVNRKPSVALRVRKQVRDFSSRLVRRCIGTQYAIPRDGRVLEKFQRITDGDRALVHEVVKQVEMLLNESDHFVTSLNTTFGEPLPPPARRATLTTAKQRVRPQNDSHEGRPASAICFLTVGAGHTRQSVPLTFELFKSVAELGDGMLAATLPRTVVALLDATRARLSGQIVRDEELLDGAEIQLGLTGEFIARELGAFVVRAENSR